MICPGRPVPDPPPRCWADTPGILPAGTTNAPECQSLGTGRLGLCPRHAEDILGEDHPVAAVH